VETVYRAVQTMQRPCSKQKILAGNDRSATPKSLIKVRATDWLFHGSGAAADAKIGSKRRMLAPAFEQNIPAMVIFGCDLRLNR